MEEELVMNLGGPTPPEPAEPAAKPRAGIPTDPLVEELLHGFEAAACTKPDFAGAPLLKKAAASVQLEVPNGLSAGAATSTLLLAAAAPSA